MSPLKVICERKIKCTPEPSLQSLYTHPAFPASVSPTFPLHHPHRKANPLSKTHRLHPGAVGMRGQLAPLSTFQTGPGDYESLTHTHWLSRWCSPCSNSSSKRLDGSQRAAERKLRKFKYSPHPSLSLLGRLFPLFHQVKFHPAFRSHIKCFLLQGDFLYYLHICLPIPPKATSLSFNDDKYLYWAPM